jgi:hypothetical protein
MMMIIIIVIIMSFTFESAGLNEATVSLRDFSFLVLKGAAACV